MKNVFLTKNNKFLEFCQTSILTVAYPGFQKKKLFSDKLILNTKEKGKRAPTKPTHSDSCYGKF